MMSNYWFGSLLGQNLFCDYAAMPRATKLTAFRKVPRNMTIFGVFVLFTNIFQYFRADLRLILSASS